MKKILFCICVLCCTVMTAVLASAEDFDFDYEGVVDYPRQNNQESESSGESDNGRVKISDGIFYDTNDRFYYYELDSGEIGLSIPCFGVSKSPVKFSYQQGMTPRIYNNGKLVDAGKENTVSEVGRYVILFDSFGREAIEFSIVSDPTCMLYGFKVPSGFRLISATLDGEQLNAGSTVDMTNEGRYSVTYGCEAGNIRETFSVSVDHTPPTLALDDVVGGYANGPVDISDKPSDASIVVQLNGSEIICPQVLTESGRYHIILTDKAGNISTYDFVIRIYFNVNSILFFALLAVAIAALAIYLIRSRRNMRVR